MEHLIGKLLETNLVRLPVFSARLPATAVNQPFYFFCYGKSDNDMLFIVGYNRPDRGIQHSAFSVNQEHLRGIDILVLDTYSNKTNFRWSKNNVHK